MNVNDGSADDLAVALAEIGLTPKAAWYSAAVLWGGGGLLFTVLYAINSTLFPRGIFYLGCVATVIGVLSLLGGRRFVGSSSITEWTTHLRLIAGLAIYVTAVPILGSKVAAFALVPLFTVPSPCYLFAWRLAVPYVVAGASIVCVAGLLLFNGPAQYAHAIVSTCAVLVIGAAMIVTRQRTLGLARRNRRLAYTDPLTGAANIRRLRERIAAEPGGQNRNAQPFALFAIDLDNFKMVNDRFDHSVGDRVLCAVAVAMDEELGPSDFVVRRGGDEFLVLAADLRARNLDELRECLESAIVRARTVTCPAITPSGSVGYVRTRPGEELGAMMERADQALHDAKIASRERRGSPASPSGQPARAAEAGSGADVSASGALGEGGASGSPINMHRRTQGPLRTVTNAFMGANPDWMFAALLLALGPAVTASLSVAQVVEPLTPIAGGAIAVGSVALALGCTWAAVSGLSPKWLHIPWLTAYALLAAEIELAGPSGTALLDLIPAIVMYGFLIFKPRTAALYLVLGQLMYGAFAIGSGFAQGVTRTVITTAVVAVVGGLVAKLRVVTIRFARRNRELSELDALTGVANMRALRDRVTDVVERASSQDLQPAIVAIDLDEFKQVNDVHSHTTGDRVLIAVARAVSERVRLDELVARRGGDEFIVVINDGGREYADAVVQRIGDAVVQARLRLCPDLRPTASVTAVSWRPGETPDDLLHRADLALHARKVESRAAPDLAATS